MKLMRCSRLAKNILTIVGVGFLFMAIASCAPPPVATTYSLEIVRKEALESNFGSPGIKVTVKNTGTGKVYNAYVSVKAKNTLGETISTAVVFFSSLSDINPGESVVGTGYFFSLPNSSAYAALTYDDPTYLKR